MFMYQIVGLAIVCACIKLYHAKISLKGSFRKQLSEG